MLKEHLLKYFFLFVPENRFQHFMQRVSSGDNFSEKNVVNSLSAEIHVAQRMVKVKTLKYP